MARELSTEVQDFSDGRQHVLTVGKRYTAQVDVTRPANVTAYTALDVVGATAAAIELPLIGPAAGHITITDIDLRMDVSAVPAGMTTFRLHFYNITPPSALADNAAWDLASGDRASYLGFADLVVPVDFGATIFSQNLAVNKRVLMGATTSLFTYLQTTAGFTPGSEDVFSLRVNAEVA